MRYELDRLVGQNIRSQRLEMGLSQEQLAAKLQLAGLDINQATLAAIEAGRRHIYVTELILFKKIFKVGYEALLP